METGEDELCRRKCVSGKALPITLSGYPGAHNRGAYWAAPCPYMGGTDRISFYHRRLDHRHMPPHVTCRKCGAFSWLDKSDSGTPMPREDRKPPYVIPSEPPISEVVVNTLAYNIEDGDPASLYLHSRGIDRASIAIYRLGTTVKKDRVSIPCRYNGKYYAIQYRLLPEFSTPKMRYLSETGSFSKILFNTEILVDIPYVLIIESPLDAVMLYSLGFPAVCSFAGNQTKGGWESTWNTWLTTRERIVIPDNDESGELIGLDKSSSIPYSRLHFLPNNVKDIGEFAKLDLSTATERISDWLKLAPVWK